jgi:putative transposase
MRDFSCAPDIPYLSDMGYLGGVSVYFPALEENQFYHIYNRGNNRCPIFFKRINYVFFLRRFLKYLSAYVDVYAYCLLRNHFHLLIRIKDFNYLNDDLKTIRCGSKKETSPRKILSEQFRRLFLSYSKAVCRQENRTGSLFQKNFQRKPVDSDKYLLDLVKYIHRNPENHGIIEDFKTYPYSSYQAIASEKTDSFIKTREVLDWFGGIESFIKAHEDRDDLDSTGFIEIGDSV